MPIRELRFPQGRTETMPRKPYPSDLTDRQWALVEARLQFPPTTRPRRRVNLREIVNAIAYRRKHGCSWRSLPSDLPPWQTVYEYLRIWEKNGTWDAIRELMEQTIPLPGTMQQAEAPKETNDRALTSEPEERN
jgi:hypothetical protein